MCLSFGRRFSTKNVHAPLLMQVPFVQRMTRYYQVRSRWQLHDWPQSHFVVPSATHCANGLRIAMPVSVDPGSGFTLAYITQFPVGHGQVNQFRLPIIHSGSGAPCRRVGVFAPMCGGEALAAPPTCGHPKAFSLARHDPPAQGSQ